MKLCDFNTAKSLQELGYDGEYIYCHVGVYPKNEYQIMALSDCEKYRHDITALCAAPRLDDAVYWIREKHHLFIEIRISLDNSYCWGICDMVHPTNDIASEQFDLEYDTYDSAIEAAVTKAIEIIKNRKL